MLVAAAIILFSIPIAYASNGSKQKEAEILKHMQTVEQQKQSAGFHYDSKAVKQLNNVKKQKAGKDYVSDEVIISVSSKEEAAAAAVFYNADIKDYGNHGMAVLKLKKGNTVIKTLEKGLNISDMAPNRIYSALDTVQYTPSDPYLSSQYSHTDMNDYAAWNITKGSGVTVAIIDTGIDTTHPEFSGRISPLSYNSRSNQVGMEYVADDYGHGTHVAGIIAAAQDNGQGGSGVAPEATIMAIKANEPAPDADSFSTYSIIQGIYYAADHGASIINMSLGSPYYYGPCALEQQAIQYAVGKGVMVICAAGNEGDDHAGYPAAYGECVAVSALRQGKVFDSTYSNYGPEVDISAPGTYIYSTYMGNNYCYMSGTSMATPQVCGVAALMKAANPGISYDEWRQKLLLSAVDKGDPGRDNYYGYGALNALYALTANIVTVSFDSQGGSNVDAIKTAAGRTIVAPGDPVLEGFVLAGWYKEKECINKWDFVTDVVSADTTLYAKWTKASFTVTFHSNGGSAVAAETVGYMQLVPEPADPVYSGYTFNGWYKDTNFSAFWDFNNDKVTGNVDLYAGWVADEELIDSPPQVPANLSASSASYKNIELNWDESDNAQGYEIYRATALHGFYALIDDIPDNYFTDAGLTTNKAYYYKIRAYAEGEDGALYSGYTAAVSAKPVPAAPQNVKANAIGKKKIKITWNKVAGAKKYEVYCAASENGKYKKITTTGSANFTQKSLKAGKTYYYKVRAYSVVKGKNVYGISSAAVSVKL